MAAFDKLPSGRWRAQIRRNGHAVSRTFRLKHEAERIRLCVAAEAWIPGTLPVA